MQKTCSEMLTKISQLYDVITASEERTKQMIASQLDDFRKSLLSTGCGASHCATMNMSSPAYPTAGPADSPREASGTNETMNSYAAVTRRRLNIPRNPITRATKQTTPIAAVVSDAGVLRSGKRRILNPERRQDQSSSTTVVTPTPKSSAIRRLEETVLFKPKSQQSAEVSKKDIRVNLDPSQFAVEDIRCRENGEVEVRCENSDIALKMQRVANGKLSGTYDISLQEALRPRVKISGFSAELNENDLLDSLKKQNGVPESAKLKVIRITKNVRAKNNTMSAVLEVDACTFDMLIKMRRVMIDWDKCQVTEAINVNRCFNCSEYGHIASSCSKPQCCPKCAEPHEAHECTSDFCKCVNCDLKNRQMKAAPEEQLDVCHSAWSVDCPIYQKRLQRSRQRIDYSI